VSQSLITPTFLGGNRVIPLRPPDSQRPSWAGPPDYPSDLIVNLGDAPEPLLPEESDLGIPLPAGSAEGNAAHKLVTIGDSLTMGFKSMAITDTKLSWPVMVADALGLTAQQFTYPSFPGPPDCPGLPLNLEAIVRGMQTAGDGQPPVLKQLRETYAAITAASHVKSYWEHGPGSVPPGTADNYYHNLAVYSWTVADAYTRTVGQAVATVNSSAGGLAAFSPIVTHGADRAMLITLRGPLAQDMSNPTTMVDAAKWLGDHGGIDTLVVALGANNALPAAVRLRLVWSDHPEQSPTVFTPSHFQAQLTALADQVAAITARRVIWATVPHVTVAPIALGIGAKTLAKRYYEHYIHAWIRPDDYLPGVNPALTDQQACAIDSAIDQYNYAIKQLVYNARTATPARDWLILDMCGLLDRLAFRRYINDPAGQPAWWQRKAYQLPKVLAALTPLPDTRFFVSDPSGRTQGGLFALDGTHPTTIGYSILADQVLKTIDHATGIPPRSIDFARYLDEDSLITHPPSSLAGDLGPLELINTVVDVGETLLGQPQT